MIYNRLVSKNTINIIRKYSNYNTIPYISEIIKSKYEIDKIDEIDNNLSCFECLDLLDKNKKEYMIIDNKYVIHKRDIENAVLTTTPDIYYKLDPNKPFLL